MEDNGVAAGAAPLEDAAEALPASDAHDLEWAINRLYLIEADLRQENTATTRNDAKAIIMVLRKIRSDTIVLEAFDRAAAARSSSRRTETGE